MSLEEKFQKAQRNTAFARQEGLRSITNLEKSLQVIVEQSCREARNNLAGGDDGDI